MVAFWRKRRNARIFQELQEEKKDLHHRVERQSSSLEALSQLLASWESSIGGNSPLAEKQHCELIVESDGIEINRQDREGPVCLDESSIVQDATDRAVAALRLRMECLDERRAAVRKQTREARELTQTLLAQQQRNKEYLKILELQFAQSSTNNDSDHGQYDHAQPLKPVLHDEKMHSTRTLDTVATDDTSVCCSSSNDVAGDAPITKFV